MRLGACKCLFITVTSGGQDYDDEAEQRRSNPRKTCSTAFRPSSECPTNRDVPSKNRKDSS